VAIVSDASLERQAVIVTDLARCADDAERLNARAPAVVAIGEVVRLHDRVAAWQQTGADSHPVAATRAPDRVAAHAADCALAALAAAAV
jgi:hypothetical protein